MLLIDFYILYITFLLEIVVFLVQLVALISKNNRKQHICPVRLKFHILGPIMTLKGTCLDGCCLAQCNLPSSAGIRTKNDSAVESEAALGLIVNKCIINIIIQDLYSADNVRAFYPCLVDMWMK